MCEEYACWWLYVRKKYMCVGVGASEKSHRREIGMAVLIKSGKSAVDGRIALIRTSFVSQVQRGGGV